MNYMLCRNRVRNFAQWKLVFDSHADAHRAAGLKLVHLWQEMDSLRNVFFLFEVEDIARARAFLDSPDAAASARESGLIEGDFRFFSQSLGYGQPGEVESSAPRDAIKSSDSAEPESSAPPEPMKNAVPAEPGESATRLDSVKNSEPEKKSSTLAEPAKIAEPAKPARISTPPPPMKGPERVTSAPPFDPEDGWQPVENWPPAEAAAEEEAESTQRAEQHRGRWVRSKY